MEQTKMIAVSIGLEMSNRSVTPCLYLIRDAADVDDAIARAMLLALKFVAARDERRPKILWVQTAAEDEPEMEAKG